MVHRGRGKVGGGSIAYCRLCVWECGGGGGGGGGGGARGIMQQALILAVTIFACVIKYSIFSLAMSFIII